MFIAAHCGAGYHAEEKRPALRKLLRQACHEAATRCRTAVEAVEWVVRALEDSPLTNAGCGSCLTLEGTVEGDATIADGRTRGFAAVGAVPGVRNPIRVAGRLLRDRSGGKLPLGLVPPAFLSGQAVREYAVETGLEPAESSSASSSLPPLVTLEQRSKWETYSAALSKAKEKLLRQQKQRQTAAEGETSSMLSPADDAVPVGQEKQAGEPEPPSSPLYQRLETVGAIACDAEGNVAAAASSGGLWLKRPGRIGHAAVYGAGCYATSGLPSGLSVASCTTGVGEQLMDRLAAREACDLLSWGARTRPKAKPGQRRQHPSPTSDSREPSSDDEEGDSDDSDYSFDLGGDDDDDVTAASPLAEMFAGSDRLDAGILAIKVERMEGESGRLKSAAERGAPGFLSPFAEGKEAAAAVRDGIASDDTDRASLGKRKRPAEDEEEEASALTKRARTSPAGATATAAGTQKPAPPRLRIELHFAHSTPHFALAVANGLDPSGKVTQEAWISELSSSSSSHDAPAGDTGAVLGCKRFRT